jgi:hypothetical protein
MEQENFHLWVLTKKIFFLKKKFFYCKKIFFFQKTKLKKVLLFRKKNIFVEKKFFFLKKIFFCKKPKKAVTKNCKKLLALICGKYWYYHQNSHSSVGTVGVLL